MTGWGVRVAAAAAAAEVGAAVVVVRTPPAVAFADFEVRSLRQQQLIMFAAGSRIRRRNV